MKRTLAISMWLAMSVAAVAQTPTVVEKPAQKTVADKTTTKTVAVNSKPSPATTAKAVPAAQSMAKVAVKPAAVPAQPATAKATPAPAAKAVTVANAKTSTAAVKPAAVPASKTSAAPTVQVKPAVKASAAPATPVVKASASPAVKANSVPAPKTASAAAVKVAAPVADAKKPVPVVAAKPTPSNVKAVPLAANKTEAKPGSANKQKDPFSGEKTVPATKPSTGTAVAVAKASTGTTVAVNTQKPAEEEKKPEPKKVSMSSRRDPFVSPVVKMGAVGSGCNSGKRCLTIDQIAVRGVVRSDNGMIAVVVNAMDKAYFLRENDPVFNGYVLKITVDSVVFKETFRDRLGKPMTRDITKTISRPAA